MRDEDRTPLQAELFGSLFLLTQHLARRTDVVMEPVGLTTKQWLLLAVLVKRFAHRSPTLSEAAQVYGSSRQNVKQIALQLQSQGYLRLVDDPQDRRVLRLELSDRIADLDSLRERERQAGLLAELFGHLSKADLATFNALVRRQLRAIAPSGLD